VRALLAFLRAARRGAPSLHPPPAPRPPCLSPSPARARARAVPFARFIALHGLSNIKRFHIARVYRRDNPAMNKGRFREFYQCDFDVAGVYAPMMPDAEVLSVVVDILASLPIGDFTVKLNHRRLLDAVLDLAGVPPSKFRAICSAIDKLDKEPWAAVRDEMVADKGLAPAAADRVGELVQRRGEPRALLAELRADAAMAGHASAAAALHDLGTLFDYLDALGALRRVTLDLSLARGLDYYTGVIYEAVLLDPTVGVGSIAAGGRYDNLVGMFSATGEKVPCVGVSVGIERVLAIMEARASAEAAAAAAAAAASAAGAAPPAALARTPVSVYVASIPSARYDMNLERMRTLAALWAAGVSAEMTFAVDPKLQKQVSAAAEGSVPFMVVLGENELDAGTVQLKDMRSRTASIVPRADVIAAVKALGATVINAAGHAERSAAEAPAAAAGAGAAAAATAAVTAAAAAPPPPAAAGSRSAAASIGVVYEGGDRPAGKFARPAVPIEI
jgi:histidyl-tRNA synthetase